MSGNPSNNDGNLFSSGAGNANRGGRGGHGGRSRGGHGSRGGKQRPGKKERAAIKAAKIAEEVAETAEATEAAIPNKVNDSQPESSTEAQGVQEAGQSMTKETYKLLTPFESWNLLQTAFASYVPVDGDEVDINTIEEKRFVYSLDDLES